MKTRFIEIMQPLSVQERLAVSAALFMAQNMEKEYTQRYGTYGWECLMTLMTSRAINCTEEGGVK